jgi:putative Mg2+ transporter-C (MgtC) family protein
MAAMLLPTTADPADHDLIAAHLRRYDAIVRATWTVSTDT